MTHNGFISGPSKQYPQTCWMKKWFLQCLLKEKFSGSTHIAWLFQGRRKKFCVNFWILAAHWTHQRTQWSLGSYPRHSAVAGLHRGLDFLKFSRGCCFAVRAEKRGSVSEPHIIPYFESYWAPWIEELCSLMFCLVAGTGRCEVAVGSDPPSLLEDQNIWDLLSLLFSCSVVSNSLWPHGLQHARLPCPSPSPGGHSNSWHPIVSSSHPFLPLPSFFFQHQGLFKCISSSHQVAKCWSFRLSVPPMNTQGWLLLGLTGLISLQSKGLSRVFSSTTVWRQFFSV